MTKRRFTEEQEQEIARFYQDGKQSMKPTTLKERFGRELDFNKYLQTSKTFRKAVKVHLELNVKGGGQYRRENQMWEYSEIDLSSYAKLDDENWVHCKTRKALSAIKPTLRCDVVFDKSQGFWGININRDCLLVEAQFGTSDTRHRNKLMRYFNASFWDPYFAKAMLEKGRIKDPYEDLKFPSSCIAWVAENFREIDIDWAREYGHPVACFQAVPKGRSVIFHAVYIPLMMGDVETSEPKQSEQTAMWS